MLYCPLRQELMSADELQWNNWISRSLISYVRCDICGQKMERYKVRRSVRLMTWHFLFRFPILLMQDFLRVSWCVIYFWPKNFLLDLQILIHGIFSHPEVGIHASTKSNEPALCIARNCHAGRPVRRNYPFMRSYHAMWLQKSKKVLL